MADMENFICNSMMQNDVDIYCGNSEKFYGKVIGCKDGVLTLRTDPDVITYVSLNKIVALWKRK
jgi:hypothetical protein